MKNPYAVKIVHSAGEATHNLPNGSEEDARRFMDTITGSGAPDWIEVQISGHIARRDIVRIRTSEIRTVRLMEMGAGGANHMQ